MYRYISLSGSDDFSGFLPVSVVQRVLSGLSELKQTSRWQFESVAGKPWLSVAILSCDSNGNHAGGIDQNMKKANLVEFVCADSEQTDRVFYEDLGNRVAVALGWSLVITE